MGKDRFDAEAERDRLMDLVPGQAAIGGEVEVVVERPRIAEKARQRLRDVACRIEGDKPIQRLRRLFRNRITGANSRAERKS